VVSDLDASLTSSYTFELVVIKDPCTAAEGLTISETRPANPPQYLYTGIDLADAGGQALVYSSNFSPSNGACPISSYTCQQFKGTDPMP